MARANPTLGEARIAAEFSLKLELWVSLRSEWRYMTDASGGRGKPFRASGQCWATLVRKRVQALVACDFCLVVTATIQGLYGFVALEVGSRRLLHLDVAAHPTAAWTLPQVREILAAPHGGRFLLHERDRIHALGLHAANTAMGGRSERSICDG